MPYGMYLSAEGAQVQSTRLEVLANNLANVDTPGFKRDVATFRARFAEAIEQGLDTAGSGSINDIGGGVLMSDVRTDYSPGTLQHTGIATDFAIDGDAFFAVRKDGETLLTRAGNFRFTADGQLVSQQGFPVLDEGGAPIVIDPNQGPWHVDGKGTLTQAGAAVPLALLQTASPGDLAKAGENLFRPLSAPQPVDPALRSVRQGYVEGSGVNPTAEMMELIETTRAFEANVNLIHNQDQMIDALINRVLQNA